MSTIQPDQLASEIMKVLDDFKEATDDVVESAIIQSGDNAVEELQAAHPDGSGQYGSWAKYNSGWTRTKLTSEGQKYSSTVHNAKLYQLTHLLEKGHAIKAGGRQVGNARAFEHIAPIAEKSENELVSKIIKGMR